MEWYIGIVPKWRHVLRDEFGSNLAFLAWRRGRGESQNLIKSQNWRLTFGCWRLTKIQEGAYTIRECPQVVTAVSSNVETTTTLHGCLQPVKTHTRRRVAYKIETPLPLSALFLYLMTSESHFHRTHLSPWRRTWFIWMSPNTDVIYGYRLKVFTQMTSHFRPLPQNDQNLQECLKNTVKMVRKWEFLVRDVICVRPLRGKTIHLSEKQANCQMTIELTRNIYDYQAPEHYGVPLGAVVINFHRNVGIMSRSNVS